LSNDESGNGFFLTSSGTSLGSGHVAKRITSFMRKTKEIKGNQSLTPTSIRKNWVTDFYAEMSPEDRRKLSTKMAHSER
jgi:hypothetical protein